MHTSILTQQGALYYLSSWYKKDETSLRITLFFFGQMFANATSQLIAAGLLTLAGKYGLSGWQWLFLSKFSPQNITYETKTVKLT